MFQLYCIVFALVAMVSGLMPELPHQFVHSQSENMIVEMEIYEDSIHYKSKEIMDIMQEFPRRITNKGEQLRDTAREEMKLFADKEVQDLDSIYRKLVKEEASLVPCYEATKAPTRNIRMWSDDEMTRSVEDDFLNCSYTYFNAYKMIKEVTNKTKLLSDKVNKCHESGDEACALQLRKTIEIHKKLMPELIFNDIFTLHQKVLKIQEQRLSEHKKEIRDEVTIKLVKVFDKFLRCAFNTF